MYAALKIVRCLILWLHERLFSRTKRILAHSLQRHPKPWPSRYGLLVSGIIGTPLRCKISIGDCRFPTTHKLIGTVTHTMIHRTRGTVCLLSEKHRRRPVTHGYTQSPAEFPAAEVLTKYDSPAIKERSEKGQGRWFAGQHLLW